ncbi:MAG: EF-hand domain-containing protein [Candidatus Sericytochromatia bacterium]|nr:EF-hand domain-containing protein [Candidatus Sericytochromatia bacterium]
MKARVLVSLVALTASLAGCGASPMLASSIAVPAAAPGVQAESFKGVGDALRRQVQRKFAERDINNNKVITPEEYNIKTPEDFVDFKQADDNGDGKITLDEMMPGFFQRANAYLKLRKSAKFMFNQLDKNDDNRITRNEANEVVLAGVEEKFNYFAKSKGKTMDKGQFTDFFVELLINGAAPLKPAKPTPPAPPAPPAPTV